MIIFDVIRHSMRSLSIYCAFVCDAHALNWMPRELPTTDYSIFHYQLHTVRICVKQLVPVLVRLRQLIHHTHGHRETDTPVYGHAITSERPMAKRYQQSADMHHTHTQPKRKIQNNM